MDADKFAIVLPVIIGGLVCKIVEEMCVSDDEGFESLYNSELYAALANEKTKLWTCSIPRLFDIYQQSVESGKLELPDY